MLFGTAGWRIGRTGELTFQELLNREIDRHFDKDRGISIKKLITTVCNDIGVGPPDHAIITGKSEAALFALSRLMKSRRAQKKITKTSPREAIWRADHEHDNRYRHMSHR